MSEIDLIIKRLKQTIESSGLTYSELENKTGVSKSALQRYANGISKKIPVDVIQAVANVANVSAAWIMGWSDNKQVCNNSQLLDYRQQKLLEYFNKLNDIGKEKAIENVSDLSQLEKYTESTESKKKNA